jgi:VanZ family protein
MRCLSPFFQWPCPTQAPGGEAIFAIAPNPPPLLDVPVARFRFFNLPWIAVLVWMVLIFSASTDAGSTKRTSRFLVPFLRWIKPDISAETLARVQYAVRKSGHVGEYCVLSLLLWQALRRSSGASLLSWSWPAARVAFLVALAYAATDELHQLFVSTRQASLMDVGIDGFGVVLGLGLVWICCRRFGSTSPVVSIPRSG